MANTKISDLSAASALDGTEEMAGVQSAANVKITPAQVRTYIRAVQHNPEGTGTFDCDDIDTGSMQIAYGNCTNAPTATSTDAFIIFTITDSNGTTTRRQVAIQLTGTSEGTIYERALTTGIWSSWDPINP